MLLVSKDRKTCFSFVALSQANIYGRYRLGPFPLGRPDTHVRVADLPTRPFWLFLVYVFSVFFMFLLFIDVETRFFFIATLNFRHFFKNSNTCNSEATRTRSNIIPHV